MSITVDQAVTWIVALLGGGASVKVMDMVMKARQAKRAQPADMTRAAGEFMESLSGGGKDLMEFFRDSLERQATKIEEQDSKIAGLEAEVRVAHDKSDRADVACAEAKEDHAKCERKLSSLQAQLDALFKDKDIPEYITLRRIVIENDEEH